jgi:hypothetical protein
MYWTIASGPPVKLVSVFAQSDRALFSLGAPAPQLGAGEKAVVPPVIVVHWLVVE